MFKKGKNKKGEMKKELTNYDVRYTRLKYINYDKIVLTSLKRKKNIVILKTRFRLVHKKTENRLFLYRFIK